jgi:voltage-gated potassium channel Kch
LQAAVWLIVVFATIAVGLIWLPREADHPGFAEALYSTLRLFVFERDLPTFPRAWPAIVIYFLAPLLTLSALGKAVTYLFRLRPLLRARWLRDHVVVCGLGTSGRLIVEALRERGVTVVGIDLADTPELEEWAEHCRALTIQGDLRRRAVLTRAAAGAARALVFATGDDLTNLDGALAAHEWLRLDARAPRLIWAHVSDDRLMATARAAIRTEGAISVRYFDTFDIAAANMVETRFPPERRAQVREVYVVGFGRFGSDLLENLLRRVNPSEPLHMTVVDRADVRPSLSRLLSHLGETREVGFLQRDVRDWEIEDAPATAFFLCTDDDLGNLSLALQLAAKAAGAYIIIRMGHWPLTAVTDQLGAERGLEFVNVAELVRRGLGELPGLFRPATADDLKRLKDDVQRYRRPDDRRGAAPPT